MNRSIPESRLYEALMMFASFLTTRKNTLLVGSRHPSTDILEPLNRFMDANGIKKPDVVDLQNFVHVSEEEPPVMHFASMFAFRTIHYGCIGCGLEMEIWNATEMDPPKTVLCKFCGDFSFMKHADPIHFHEAPIRKMKWFTTFDEADAIKAVNDLLDNAELKILLLNRKTMFEKLAEYMKKNRPIIKEPYHHCGIFPKKFIKNSPVLK